MDKSIRDKLVPTVIDGKSYYTVKQFSFLTDRTNQTIYKLIREGNAIRKLSCIHHLGIPFIPISEKEEFPFPEGGPSGKNRVYYNKEEKDLDTEQE